MLIQLFDCAETVNVYFEGNVSSFTKRDENYQTLIYSWKNTINDCLEMPAYCVSLDSDTKNALKSDVWLEFCFPKIFEYEGMDFQKLLVNVKSKNLGCDLIRYNPDLGYEGRCYHLRLNGDMSEIYNCIINLKK